MKEKQYKTRDGQDARIICTDVKYDEFPVVALLTNKKGNEHVRTYTKDLKYLVNEDSKFDLFEVKEQIPWYELPISTKIKCKNRHHDCILLIIHSANIKKTASKMKKLCSY